MAWWSISLFLLSVTYLTYHHPPATWTLLPQWMRPAKRRRQLESTQHDLTDEKEGPGRGSQLDGEKSNGTSTGDYVQSPSVPSIQTETEDGDVDDDDTSQDGDMTPQAKPIAVSAAEVPSFTLDDSHTDGHDREDEEDEQDERDNLPPPMFPAMNSAQRASKPPPSISAMPPPPPPTKSITKASPTFMPPPPALPRNTSSLMPPPRGPPIRAPQTSPSSLRVPANGPLPNRGGGLQPPLSSAAQARGSLAPSRIDTPNSRNKVHLTPGHSPLDWATLSRSKNLSGVSSFQRVTPTMLKHYNGRKDKVTGEKRDAWSVYQGKVYNISPYLDFHPGGVGELLRGAGKDGTKLFMEVHPWVNWEGMMGNSCLVGVMVAEDEGEDEGLEGLD